MHFLQSTAWEAFQQSLGRKTFRRQGEGWSYLAILEEGKFGIHRLYCPYGPTVESPHALNTALDSLTALAQSQKVTTVRIEPLGSAITNKTLLNLNLYKTDYSSPAHSWYVDLTQTKDDILAQMNQNNRNIYRNYHKKGMSHEVSTDPHDISHLITLLQGVADHNKITVHSDEYFTKQATVLIENNAAEIHLMRFENEVIAAALVYLDETTAYYAHAAADHEHRKLNASTALLAEIIFNAKANGKKVCDLYGITDSDDPAHRWAGFSKFKKSFGGYAVTYVDTFEKPIRVWRYGFYQTLRNIKRLLN